MPANMIAGGGVSLKSVELSKLRFQNITQFDAQNGGEIRRKIYDKLHEKNDVKEKRF